MDCSKYSGSIGAGSRCLHQAVSNAYNSGADSSAITYGFTDTFTGFTKTVDTNSYDSTNHGSRSCTAAGNKIGWTGYVPYRHTAGPL